MSSSALTRGRQAFERRNWSAAYRELTAARSGMDLQAEDLQLLFIAAHLTGRDSERNELAVQAYRKYVEGGNLPAAVRCGFHLIMGFAEQKEYAQAGGWLGRARELLDEYGLDCVEQGYLMLPVALQSLDAGDAAGAMATFAQVAKIAQRYGDADLETMSRIGRGRALINLGEAAEGAAMLDQAMTSVTAGELTPMVSGVVYCAVIEMCRDIFDLGRAQEWTAALAQWCSTQPGLVPYRGQCLVYRVEIMRLRGAWQDAAQEAREACDLLAGNGAEPLAHYQQAELYRLTGRFGPAEESYRLVSRLGGSPQPGLALLRLAQGQVQTAESSIRLAVDEARSPIRRAPLLAGCAEILLAAEHIQQARSVATELSAIARNLDSPLLDGTAAYVEGSVRLAAGEVEVALPTLRRAWHVFRELDAAYDGARTRVLIGLACRQLGDEDTAQMEFDAARWVFGQMGAAVDQARVDRLLARREATPGGLTGREVEVLCLVAAGMTNRAIAAELFLADKTVARHVSNIFTKLGVSSRSAATAFAFQNHLIPS